MKISIITVCYNSATTIRDTIESVLSQTYHDIEYIIVDGASRDETIRIVDEYRHRVARVISEPDKGIYDAMNKGVAAATGDVVGVLNSDDVFANRDAVAAVAAGFSEDVDGVFSDLVYVQREDVRRVTRTYRSGSFASWKIRFGLTLPHPTFYVRREFYQRWGGYKLGYRVAADFELIARFIKRGLRLRHLETILVRMREGGISSNGFWWRVHQNFEIVRACRENRIYTNILFVSLKIPFKLMTYGRTG